MKKIRQQFADTMLEVGKQDPNLVVLIGDISHFVLQPFAEACPGRFYNIGICEPTIISMAAGLAKTGFHPVVHTIAPFLLERSFEQIKLDFCYQKLSGNIVTVGSSFDYSNLGVTHHCYDDFSLIKSLQNTQIIFPATSIEFEILFKQAYKNKFLTIYRLPEHQHQQNIDSSEIEIGKAVKIVEGNDITIVVTGPQLKNAIEARKSLSNLDWDADIIYVHTIKPFDIETVRTSVEKTGRVLVIEEHNSIGGMNEDVLRAVYNINDLQFHSLGIGPFIHDYGTYDDLCQKLGLSAEGILRAVANNFNK